MSNILAIETSTPMCSVAVRCGGQLEVASTLAHQSHSEMVLEMVEHVLGRARLTLAECDAIAFGAGPGSFTGLRIACSVAQGLAFGSDCPVIAVNTLAALAEQACGPADATAAPGPRVLCALDARMGEVYWSLLQRTKGTWLEHIAPTLSRPSEIAAELIRPVEYGCGSAFALFAPDLEPLVQTVLLPRYPEAGAVAKLGQDLYAAGRFMPPALAQPLYVRDRVALTTAERAAQAELER
ncbi:MAG: tRNA (adenosine(37)-N6)-threonylcarbamoyltransferase complex dimerization subunit type 1 TsaB [Burkholderiaceae bacterium]